MLKLIIKPIEVTEKQPEGYWKQVKKIVVIKIADNRGFCLTLSGDWIEVKEFERYPVEAMHDFNEEVWGNVVVC